MQAFGETVTYYPANGAPVMLGGEFGGVFNDKFEQLQFEDGLSVSSPRPVLNIRAAAFAREPWQNEILVIRGRSYIIADPPERDTIGDLRLFLRLANNQQA